MSPDCGYGKPISVAQNVSVKSILTRKFDKVPGKSDIEQRQIAQVRIASYISKKSCTSSMTPYDVPRDFRPYPEEGSEEREEGGTKQGEKVRMEERERERAPMGESFRGVPTQLSRYYRRRSSREGRKGPV